VTESTKLFAEAVSISYIGKREKLTFFCKFGNIFTHALAIVALLFVLIALLDSILQKLRG
jgi:hypothetical protein